MHASRPRRRLLAGLAAGVLAATGGLAACSDRTDEQVTQVDVDPRAALPEHFPVDFPVPDELVPAGRGDAAAFAVDDHPDAVFEFYVTALGESGWDIADEWEGFTPRGGEARGLMFQRGDASGALAISAGEEYASIVQITLQEDAEEGGPPPDGHHGHGSAPQ